MPRENKRQTVPSGFLERYRWKLKRKGILVYYFLRENSDKDYDCTLSYKEIAKGLGLSNASTVKVLNRLEEFGVISINRSGEKTVYRLLWVQTELPFEGE